MRAHPSTSAPCASRPELAPGLPMRGRRARFALGVLALLTGIAMEAWAETGMGTVNVIKLRVNPRKLGFTEIRCGSRNPADGGPNIAVTPDAGKGAYSALKCQVRTAMDAGSGGKASGRVYCGAGGNFTAANFDWGEEHCADCDDGPSWEPGISAVAAYKCVTGGDIDAGVDIFCSCGL